MKTSTGFRGAALSLVLAVTAFACGSGGAGSSQSASGVSASKKLVDLTAAEKGRLCDWMVGRAGSYGKAGTCDRTKTGGDTPFLAYDDQAACVADSADQTFTDCKATVTQLEACVLALPTCATLTDAGSTAACALVDGC